MLNRQFYKHLWSFLVIQVKVTLRGPVEACACSVNPAQTYLVLCSVVHLKALYTWTKRFFFTQLLPFSHVNNCILVQFSAAVWPSLMLQHKPFLFFSFSSY